MEKTDFSFYKKGKQLYYEQLARSYRSKKLIKQENWAPFEKDLEEAKFALISVAGAYLDDQEPFTEEEKESNFEYRKINANYDEEEINFYSPDWDSSEAEEDPNVVFPINNLVLLQKEGVLWEVDKEVYSFSDHREDEDKLNDSIDKMVEELTEKEIDGALIIPAAVESGEVAWRISNKVEGAGISTALISMFYEQVLQKPAPRSAYINFPFGRPLGPADSITVNTAILRDLLRLFEKNTRPGKILTLNYIWSWGEVPV